MYSWLVQVLKGGSIHTVRNRPSDIFMMLACSTRSGQLPGLVAGRETGSTWVTEIYIYIYTHTPGKPYSTNMAGAGGLVAICRCTAL